MVETTHAAEAVEKGLTIHLAPEVLGHLGGIPITNTILTTTFVAILVIVLALFFRRKYRFIPGKAQVLLEAVIGGAFDYMAETLENKELARKVFPYIMTIFTFVLAINWVGLLPGVDGFGIYKFHEGHETLVPFLHPGNTDLNITIAFAIIAFVTIEVVGVATLGFLKYTGKFVNFSGFKEGVAAGILGLIIGIIELIGEVARLVAFSFRLFGNIFAGKTLLLTAIFFVPFVLPVPILAFEVFVGFIQALVLAVLTLFFIKLAIADHSAEAHSH